MRTGRSWIRSSSRDRQENPHPLWQKEKRKNDGAPGTRAQIPLLAQEARGKWGTLKNIPMRKILARLTLLAGFFMPAITALIHTHNDGLRLGRVLETLYPCDEIVVVDHESHDGTARVAREYGARVIAVKAGVSPAHYFSRDLFSHDHAGWILCLDPRESLTEGLAASLFEWKTETAAGSAFSVFLREETAEGWIENPVAQTRLVPAGWSRWEKLFPSHDAAAVALEGELLRFALP